MTYSLQRFLLIVALVSIAVPAVITGGLIILENYKRKINWDSRVTVDNYLELLEAGMRMPMWNIAPSLGQPLLDAISLDPSVHKVYVIGATGEPFLSYVRPGLSGKEESISGKALVTFEGESLGEIELVYGLSNAKQVATSESNLILTIIVIQLLVSVSLLAFVLRRRVIMPLEQLEIAAQGIASGDLMTAIPRLKDDEFGALSTQLESMRGSLQQSFTNLEERVRERTADLVNVNDELKGALDRLRQTQGHLVQSEKLAALGSLVAGIAHELNTPIGNGLTVSSSLSKSTRGMLEKMEDGMKRSDLEEYLMDMKEGTHLVSSSLERASELVTSFKQVAMDRTSAMRRDFLLVNVLRETRLTMSPMFKHTPYQIHIDVDDSIRLDSYPGPLGQVITNLLTNALVHAFEGCEQGSVNIVAEKDSEQVILKVCDDGVGIKKEHLNRIFDPFFTTKLGAGGNGLGMHIVHNIVYGVLGGSVMVESEEQVGTDFIIILPLVAPEAPPADSGNEEDRLS